MPIHVVNIEDDRSLRDILRVAFRAVEPRVELHQFSSADEALPYIEQNAQDIDLFVLDMRLPGTMNGLQIAKKIRERNCPGHVVLSSAYAAPDRDELDSLDAEFFPKPWHVLDMTRKLMERHLKHPTLKLAATK